LDDSKAWMGSDASLGVLGILWDPIEDILPVDDCSVFNEGRRETDADPDDLEVRSELLPWLWLEVKLGTPPSGELTIIPAPALRSAAGDSQGIIPLF
jgi:hypothetical protein